MVPHLASPLKSHTFSLPRRQGRPSSDQRCGSRAGSSSNLTVSFVRMGRGTVNNHVPAVASTLHDTFRPGGALEMVTRVVEFLKVKCQSKRATYILGSQCKPQKWSITSWQDASHVISQKRGSRNVSSCGYKSPRQKVLCPKYRTCPWKLAIFLKNKILLVWRIIRMY